MECDVCGHLVCLGECLGEELLGRPVLCHLCEALSVEEQITMLYNHWYFGQALQSYVFLAFINAWDRWTDCDNDEEGEWEILNNEDL